MKVDLPFQCQNKTNDPFIDDVTDQEKPEISQE
jgi:hypothetical protein